MSFPTIAPITIDLHRFADENMHPEEYVRRALGDANEEGIRAFHKSLIESKYVVGGDLQRNVYRNYTEFVAISKEISNLDSDVLHLKGYLNELRTIWESFLASTNSSSEDSILPPRKRNELMTTDMQSVYRAQITALWENVEGSQRFIPSVQDRHIIRECVNFYELDPQTGTPRQAVHIFLLNNCILVATRKKRSMANRYKLVAEYCWNLEDTTMVDVKDSPAEKAQDKIGLFHAYRRIMDEDEDGQHDPINNGNSTKNITLNPIDQKWLVEFPDELEVLIAIREFENAVTVIERAKVIFSQYSVDSPVLREPKIFLQKYTDQLCEIISHDLGNILLTKLQFQRFVGWLLRLEKGEQAREVFLATRSLIIKKRIRQLIFEGDIQTYISELALVVFTLIRNTCEWYRDSFKQNNMASGNIYDVGFVMWVREQANVYATIYRRQVFNHSQLSCQVISDCFKSTIDQCAMLRKVGLDLKFLLEDLFLENVKETVRVYEKTNAEKAEKFAKSDTFAVVASQNLGNYILRNFSPW
ncbi:Cullin repeat-like-containing domain protein [Spinellus fusiger]|nr:Cullin repeat-like-containing domain protein [Spinellus fusiger]